MDKKDYYILGKITKKHGFQGNVVLRLDTDQPEIYHKLDSVFIEINGLLVPFFVEKQSWMKNDAKILTFRNVTENQANQTIGKDVYLPLSSLPQLKGKQFYYHEVIGFKILDENEKFCGTIKSISDQTVQPYFSLELEGKEVIIPIIKDWILEVNREGKFIKMQLPEGLLDVFTQPAIKDE